MAITIGAPAIDRSSGLSDDWTGVNKEGPADGDGSITSVEMWARDNITDCKVATFIQIVDLTFSTRDTETIGAVTSGSKQTFAGLDMDVITGDYIGIYFSEDSNASLEMDTEGGEGYWTVNADYIPCTEQDFLTLAAGRTLSLYGTGAVGGVTYDEKGRTQIILAVGSKGDLATSNELAREQVTLATLDEVENFLFPETGREQVILASQSKGEQLVIIEPGTQTILGIISESDLVTFLDTLKPQAVLAIISESDSTTFLEMLKLQTILGVIGAVVGFRFFETDKLQTVLAIVEKLEQLIKVEIREQTILGMVSEIDVYIPSGVIYDETGKEQVILAIPAFRMIQIVRLIRRIDLGYTLGRVKPTPHKLGESLDEYTLGGRIR